MEPMSVLLTMWGVLTTVLVVLLIYRSALARHEDDELFLTSADAHFEKEQQELTVRMNRLRPFLNILAASSGLLILLMAGLWVWRGWNRGCSFSPAVAPRESYSLGNGSKTSGLGRRTLPTRTTFFPSRKPISDSCRISPRHPAITSGRGVPS